MQTSAGRVEDQQEPLLPGETYDDREVETSPPPSSYFSILHAYRQGAMAGTSALAVQGFGVVFVVLIWSLVFTTMPLTPLPAFGYHPILQSLALLLLLQSIMTLQPTTGAQPAQKQSAFKVHQILNITLVLPLFTIGAAIMWNLHDKPGAAHFVSWHGTFGVIILLWAWGQVAVGVAVSAFGGRLAGGQTRAKSLYKWHRLSGYILLPLFLLTAFMGATQTTWSQQNASNTHHTAVAICLLGAAGAMLVRIQFNKLPH